MADELRILARKLDQPIVGDKMQVYGKLIGTGVIDAGNSQSYTIPEGAQQITLIATTSVWVNITAAGTSAAVDGGEWVPAGVPIDIASTSGYAAPGHVIKCIVDA